MFKDFVNREKTQAHAAYSTPRAQRDGRLTWAACGVRVGFHEPLTEETAQGRRTLPSSHPNTHKFGVGRFARPPLTAFEGPSTLHTS